MQPTDSPTSRTASARRARPALVREFAGGAVLGALIWLAVCTLGFHSIFDLSAPGGIVPAAVLGGLLALSPYRWLLWLTGGAVTALYAIVAFTPVIVQPAQALIRSDPLPSAPLKLDAVVVLSEYLTRDGLLGADGTERLLSGLSVAKATGTTTLVTTRVRHPAALDVTSDADQKKLVELMGAEVSRITTPDVFSTRDEALRVRDLARRHGWARVAVVTSPLHSRRACGTFEKVGLRVTCIPAESRGVAFKALDLPTDRIRAFRLWIYEIAGTINYRLKGWLP